MQARAMRGEGLRIVLRLFDDDLAQRVSETLGNVGLPVGLLPGGARVRGGDARAQGAAHHRRSAGTCC